MSKVKKKFDCVEMKREVQRRIADKHKSRSPEEIRIQNEKKLEESTSELARWWRSLPKGPQHRGCM